MSKPTVEDMLAEPEGWWWRYLGRHFWRVYRVLGRAKEAAEEWWQRHTIGYAYVEASNLCDYLARYALPRVRYLRDHHVSHPNCLAPEDWQAILDDIVYALELKVRWESGDGGGELPDGEPRYEHGLQLFGEWWQHLWD